MSGGRLDAAGVTRQGITLGVRLATMGPSREALPTVADAWADLPPEEGRMMLAITSTWLSAALIPKLMGEAARRGVDLMPVLERQAAHFLNGAES